MPRGVVESPGQKAEDFLEIVQNVLEGFEPKDFKLKLWDGTVWDPEPDQPTRFSITIHNPAFFSNLFSNPSLETLGESYIHGLFDVEGDFTAARRLAEFLSTQDLGFFRKLSLAGSLLKGSFSTIHRTRKEARLSGDPLSKERTFEAVNYHYDLPTDFWRLFLDREMVYSCAYFESEDEDLDTAQKRKLDFICRKLNLSPGETLLDLGCGWGGLLIHAVAHYGVQGYGVTLNRRQADYASHRIQQLGLTDRCRVEVRDFRDIPEEEEFDKVSSVGMIEHVQERLQPEYFRRVWNHLKPSGLFFNQGISVCRTRPKGAGNDFIQRFIFPDHELVPITTTLRIGEECGFEVRDVESLREHYALTLTRWWQRLENHHRKAIEIVGEGTYRAFRAYLAGTTYDFQTGSLNLYQTVFAKPGPEGETDFPLTRSGWYRGDAVGSS